VFVLISIIRAEYTNTSGQTQKTKSQILGKALVSFFIFLLVPFLIVSGILFSNTIMQSMNLAMNPSYDGSYQTTIGGQILVTAGSNAFIGDEDEKKAIEQAFASGRLDYNDIKVVKQYYDLQHMDFFVGIVGSLVILVMFVMSAVMFIQRIFDIVLLFIISPISISTIPVDDGNRFRIWREMTISKVLGAYGIILAMNLFFIIIPQISGITFFGNGFQNGLVRLLFIIGGAFAVTKANLVISQLTGGGAGNQEAQQMMANMRTARNITMGGFGLAGAIMGGSQFMSAKRMGGFKGGIQSAFNTPASKIMQAPSFDNKNSKIMRYAGIPSRIASMPVGMIKDLASGGIVGMAKNIVPRTRNIGAGASVFNHAQAQRKKPTTPQTATTSTTATTIQTPKVEPKINKGGTNATNTQKHKS